MVSERWAATQCFRSSNCTGVDMRILKSREHHSETSYHLSYHWRGDAGAGFCFDCDENGNVDVASMIPVAYENYQKCVNGDFDVVCDGVEEHHHNWTSPAVGECPCGGEVELAGFTNTCEKCGRDFNMSGQELADRSQWGEETGESLADIMRIP